MKKLILPILAAFCMIGLTACGGSDSAGSTAADAQTAQTTVTQETAAPSTDTTAAPEKDDAALPEQTAASEAGETAEGTGKDKIVVYFSATGTTKGVAERIAHVTDADLFELIPAEPYSAADLDWNDRSSRTTREMNDPDVRPAIANDTVDLSGYTTVYLGYPIWWGDAPRMMSTFVEAHDFDGKTVIPFCTSGGSPIGRSGENLASQAGSGNWLSGGRLDAGISEDAIRDWISGMQ